MNKQQLIEKAVIDLDGKWPKKITAGYMSYDGCKLFYDATGYVACIRDEFEATAKRMGYINGYKWGVEYLTNGKRPELADGTLVELTFVCGTKMDCKTSSTTFESRPIHDPVVVSFRITDQRHKPAEPEQAPAKPWFEAGELPKAGTKCLCFFDDGRECWHECVVIGSIDEEIKNGYLAVSLIGKHERKLVWVNDFKPIKTDKENAIEFALGKINNGMNRHAAPYIIEQLYDAGLLRLPEQK